LGASWEGEINNHPFEYQAMKNSLEPKYVPGLCVQYGQPQLLSTKGRMLDGVPFTLQIKVGAFLVGGSNDHPFNFPCAAVGWDTSFHFFNV
jgi:hypothetical protein